MAWGNWDGNDVGENLMEGEGADAESSGERGEK